MQWSCDKENTVRAGRLLGSVSLSPLMGEGRERREQLLVTQELGGGSKVESGGLDSESSALSVLPQTGGHNKAPSNH